MGFVGIVAGVGPYAGLYFHERWLKDAGDVKKDQDHIPIILYSVPHEIIDRSEYLLNPELENPAIAMAGQITNMYKCGARIFGIFCNTAHSLPIWSVVEEKTKHLDGIRLVNMVEATMESVESAKAPKIGLLATMGTYTFKIYESYAANYKLDIITPDEEFRKGVHDAIYNPDHGIKRLGTLSTESEKLIYAAVANMKEKSELDYLILGCTELPMVIDENKIKDIKLLDPTSFLIKKLKSEYRHG